MDPFVTEFSDDVTMQDIDGEESNVQTANPTPLTDEHWELHRSIIEKYYEEMSLKALMAKMSKEHRFHATKDQYTRQFSLWKVTKYIRKPLVRKMAEIQQRRLRENKETQFVHRGRVIDPGHLERSIKRSRRAFKSVAGIDMMKTPASLEYWTPGNSHRDSIISFLNGSPSTSNWITSYSTQILPSSTPSDITSDQAPHTEQTYTRIPMSVLSQKRDVKLPLTPKERRMWDYLCSQFIIKGSLLTISPCTTADGIKDALSNALRDDDRPYIVDLLGFLYGHGHSFEVRCPVYAEMFSIQRPIVRHFHSSLVLFTGLQLTPTGECSSQSLHEARVAYEGAIPTLVKHCAGEYWDTLCRVGVISEATAMRAVTKGILHGRRNWLIHFLCDTFPRVLNLDYIIAAVPDIRAAAASNASIFQSVAVLLRRSFDGDGNRNTSSIALDVAVQLLLRNSVEEMLHDGANINQQLDKGESLLHILAGLLHLDVIPMAEVLLTHRLDVHLIDNAGNTCLHTAFQHGWNNWTERFADLLIRHGANINAQNAAGQTCLQAAIAHYFIKTTFSLVSMSQDLPTAHSPSFPLPPFAAATSSPGVIAQHSAALASLTSWFERNGGDMSIGNGDESITAPNLEEMDYIFSHQEDVMHTLDLFAEWDFES